MSKFIAIFAGGTLFSRVLGLARDVVWFALVESVARDAFLVAFKFPNMLRDLLGEGAMNAAFVPVFSETLEKHGKEAHRQLIASAMLIMLFVFATVTAVGMYFLPRLMHGLNSLQQWTGGSTRTDTELEYLAAAAFWTFPYIFLMGMAVFAMGGLFSVKHFATPAWSPALLNVAFIAGCFAFLYGRSDVVTTEQQIWVLVGCAWAGGLGQLIAMFIALRKHTGITLPSFRLNHPGLRTIFVLMIPVIFGQAAGEVNKLVDTLFAAKLADGAVTALWGANRLVQLPLAVFAAATAAVILPTGSEAAAAGDTARLRETQQFGLRQTYFLVFPAMLGLFMLGKPIVQVLFEHGQFTPKDTAQTVHALNFCAAGLLGFAGVKVLVMGFYADQRTKVPVLVSALCMVLNIALNIMLVRRMGFGGLAFATSVAFTANFIMLYGLFSHRYGRLHEAPFVTAIFRMTVAGLVMAVVLYGMSYPVSTMLAGDGFALQVGRLGALLAAGAGAYAVFCHLLGVEELRRILGALRRRA
jgi:putative peptidoglycan lipid II flippase